MDDVNDVTASSKSEVDRHGHAALLLVESLMHSLVAGGVISLDDAIDVIQSASDVEDEFCADEAASSHLPVPAARLLSRIELSFAVDLPRT